MGFLSASHGGASAASAFLAITYTIPSTDQADLSLHPGIYAVVACWALARLGRPAPRFVCLVALPCAPNVSSSRC